MIPIQPGPEPPILAANSIAWGQEFAQALASGEALPARYRCDDVRDALRAETRGKCAYCESSIEHISYVHIEHILPKSVLPLLVCVWTNLTIACERCNKNKGDYYSVEVPLLNPYLDDVASDVAFYGPMAIHRSDCARFTIARLKLNRADLLFRRQTVLAEAHRILELLVKTNDNEVVRAALLEDLNERLAETSEYTSCVRFFTDTESARLGIEVRPRA